MFNYFMINNKPRFSSAKYDFEIAVAVNIDETIVDVEVFDIATRVIEFYFTGYFLEYASCKSFLLNGENQLDLPVMIYVGCGNMDMSVGTDGKSVTMEYKGYLFEHGESVFAQAPV